MCVYVMRKQDPRCGQTENVLETLSARIGR